MNSHDVKRAVIRWLTENRYLSVTECNLHSACGNVDVVGIKLAPGYNTHEPVKFLAEFEVKVSKSDLWKDLEKRKWYFWAMNTPSTHLWYVVPVSLKDEALKVASELEKKLRGEISYGKETQHSLGIYKTNPLSKKARVGVLVCHDEHTVEKAKPAVRVQKTATREAVNSVVGRSLWELYNLRGLRTKKQDTLIDQMKPGDLWISGGYFKKRRTVRVLAYEDGFVQHENVDTGRKGRSKVSSFLGSYRPR